MPMDVVCNAPRRNQNSCICTPRAHARPKSISPWKAVPFTNPEKSVLGLFIHNQRSCATTVTTLRQVGDQVGHMVRRVSNKHGGLRCKDALRLANACDQSNLVFDSLPPPAETGGRCHRGHPPQNHETSAGPPGLYIYQPPHGAGGDEHFRRTSEGPSHQPIHSSHKDRVGSPPSSPTSHPTHPAHSGDMLHSRTQETRTPRAASPCKYVQNMTIMAGPWRRRKEALDRH